MSRDTHLPQRKDDHLRINLEKMVQSSLSTGLEQYHFIHTPLPEIDFDKVTTNTSFIGFQLRAPFLISSMTGGTEAAYEINHRLASAAQSFKIPIGVGSQRAAIENPDAIPSFAVVRKQAPDTLVFANLGAVQLNYGCDIDTCRFAVDMIEADALFLHLNPLQEALQVEGQASFSGLLNKIENVCRSLEVPVFIKEVGWGIDIHSAHLLIDAGVRGIDVAGAGGTSWSEVEKQRTEDPVMRGVAAGFQGWGHPTARNLLEMREHFPGLPLIASGGIQNGIDAAKCLALGADITGAAHSFLNAAFKSEEGIHQKLNIMIEQLRTVMFVTGCSSLAELRSKPIIERIEK